MMASIDAGRGLGGNGAEGELQGFRIGAAKPGASIFARRQAAQRAAALGAALDPPPAEEAPALEWLGWRICALTAAATVALALVLALRAAF